MLFLAVAIPVVVGQVRPPVAADDASMLVEEKRIADQLAGTVDVWMDGKADKPVVTSGTYKERTRIGNAEFLVFTEADGTRVMVRTEQISVMRIRK